MSVLSRLVLMGLAAFFSCSATSKEMTFNVISLNHLNIIVADGEITSDTPERFRKFMTTERVEGYTIQVALNSPGGNLQGGLGLGRLVRSHGFDTVVFKYRTDSQSGKLSYRTQEAGGCYSACAMAFLGGERRSLDPQSRLGFHQFSSARGSMDQQGSVLVSEARSQLMGAELLDYIVDMGVAPTLYSRLSKTLPSEMYLPESSDLRPLEITTKAAFQEFGFEPYGKGAIAYAKFPENAVGRQLVSQISTYCKSGVPYLLLSKPEGVTVSPDIHKGLMENQKGFSISSEIDRVEYGPDAVAIRRGGQPVAEIRLDQQGARMLTKSSAGGIMVGAIYGQYSFEVEPSQEDAKRIEASFRLCIS